LGRIRFNAKKGNSALGQKKCLFKQGKKVKRRTVRAHTIVPVVTVSEEEASGMKGSRAKKRGKSKTYQKEIAAGACMAI